MIYDLDRGGTTCIPFFPFQSDGVRGYNPGFSVFCAFNCFCIKHLRDGVSGWQATFCFLTLTP